MRSYAAIFLACLLQLTGCRQNNPPQALEVMYIANEGYMISMGDTKLLIDAFSQSEYYASPAESTVAKMTDGIPPFDSIDYLLVTHDHPDHFNAEMVSRFLRKHPDVQFVADSGTCRKMAGEGIAAGRCSGIILERGGQQLLRGKKAEILAISLDHGSSRSMSNLAFLVHSNGHTIVHVGDAKLAFSGEYLRQVDWASYSVDLLFLQASDRSTPTQEIIERLIRPKRVILMHIPPGEEESVRNEKKKVHPETYVFSREQETMEFGNPGK